MSSGGRRKSDASRGRGAARAGVVEAPRTRARARARSRRTPRPRGCRAERRVERRRCCERTPGVAHRERVRPHLERFGVCGSDDHDGAADLPCVCVHYRRNAALNTYDSTSRLPGVCVCGDIRERLAVRTEKVRRSTLVHVLCAVPTSDHGHSFFGKFHCYTTTVHQWSHKPSKIGQEERGRHRRLVQRHRPLTPRRPASHRGLPSALR